MRRTSTVLMAAFAVLLTVSACGGGGGGDTKATSNGPTDVTVGVIPIVDTAPIWLGKAKGFFKDEGINLDIKTTTGGAAAVPGVVSGDFDFAFGNVVSLMVAADQGLGVKFVTNGDSTTGGAKDFGAVVVPADSPIKSAKDLVGKTVSVNNLKNIGDTTIRYAIEKGGGDPKAVKFVEVAFPDAPAALAKKQVDAVWVLEPFLSQVLGEGGRVVSWNYVEMSPKLDIAGYFTTDKFIAENKDLTEKFTAAMNKSLDYAQQHPDEVRAIVGTYTKIDEATRAKMTLPAFRAEFDRQAAATVGDAAVKYGTLKHKPDLEKLFP
jgi:NitT/TauT family transport system substrate-binding protein